MKMVFQNAKKDFELMLLGRKKQRPKFLFPTRQFKKKKKMFKMRKKKCNLIWITT